jgi:pyruvate dehydrogenase E1 component alpha subunit
VTKQELIDFENRIADQFNKGKIRAPVHLYYGNEDEIINIFKDVRQQDWVFCSWRSHYQCLLKGVPADEIEKEILEGRSISLCFPEHKIYSSAIVGGILPIAVGTAMSIKKDGGDSKVYCFMGDMTSETGIAHESMKYAIQHNLPIKFIIEDNGKSVCTDTNKTWGVSESTYKHCEHESIYYYEYETKYPHAGAGMRVQF